MWLGSKHQVEKITVHDIPVLQSSTTTVDIARDLGVLLDSQLTMSEQVYVGTSRRCMSISIQLSSPAPPCRSSAVGRSKEDGSPRICVFVQSTTAISLLFGVADSLVQRLQAVQNASARLVSIALADPSTSRQY